MKSYLSYLIQYAIFSSNCGVEWSFVNIYLVHIGIKPFQRKSAVSTQETIPQVYETSAL